MKDTSFIELIKNLRINSELKAYYNKIIINTINIITARIKINFNLIKLIYPELINLINVILSNLLIITINIIKSILNYRVISTIKEKEKKRKKKQKI